MVREPIASGFYPENSKILKLMLDKLFDGDKKNTVEEVHVTGLVAPHAGYLYSGKTAAKVYSLIEDHYDSVVILGPDHTGLAETASISIENWKMPFGEVEVDKELGRKIISESDLITEDENAHMYEHSIEVQLPFLQYKLKEFKFVPITIPHTIINIDTLQEIADAISSATIEKNVLFIASSDLTHFGKGYGFVPVETDEIEWIRKTDNEIMASITELDELQTLNKSKKSTVCGSIPIAILIMILKNKKIESGTIIDYSTSYDTSKDKNIIVGYGGIVF